MRGSYVTTLELTSQQVSSLVMIYAVPTDIAKAKDRHG